MQAALSSLIGSRRYRIANCKRFSMTECKGNPNRHMTAAAAVDWFFRP